MRLAEGQPKNVKDALLRYPNEPYDDSMTKTLKGRGQIVSDMLADRSHLLGHEENARLYQAVHMEYVRMPEDSIAVAPRTHFRRGPSLTCGDQIICD